MTCQGMIDSVKFPNWVLRKFVIGRMYTKLDAIMFGTLVLFSYIFLKYWKILLFLTHSNRILNGTIIF